MSYRNKKEVNPHYGGLTSFFVLCPGEDLVTNKFLMRQKFFATPPRGFLRPRKKHRSGFQDPHASAVGALASRVQKKRLWPFVLCPGEDLNLQALRHTYLKRTRLPISPPGHLLITLVITNFRPKCHCREKIYSLHTCSHISAIFSSVNNPCNTP